MAKVSIIIPVYNTREYLPKCLDSLVNQTLQEIEIVLINDGSTDDSLAIINQYKEKHPDKIKVISKENGGQGAARNLGIKECSGDYIGFVDSDDYVDIHMYEEMLTLAEQENLDLVECEYQYIREETGEQLKTYGDVRNYKGQKDMFLNPLVSPWNKLIRADILKNMEQVFPEGLIYEDTAFFIKIIPYVHSSKLVEKPFVFHILRGGSTMSINKSKRVGNIFPVLKDILDFYQKEGFYDEFRMELEYFCVKILLCSSLQRIADVPDRKLKKEFSDKTLEMLRQEFPGYKSNPYMERGMKNLYMKSVNKVTMPVYVFIFKWIKL